MPGVWVYAELLPDGSPDAYALGLLTNARSIHD